MPVLKRLILLSRKKTVRDDCVNCHKPLPIGVGVHRLYCNECQRILRSKAQKERYQKMRKKVLSKAKRVCKLCKKEFTPNVTMNTSLKICKSCTNKFLERRNNIRCLYCGKLIPKTDRIKFFCNAKCSIPSWYVLKRTIGLKA